VRHKKCKVFLKLEIRQDRILDLQIQPTLPVASHTVLLISALHMRKKLIYLINK